MPRLLSAEMQALGYYQLFWPQLSALGLLAPFHPHLLASCLYILGLMISTSSIHSDDFVGRILASCLRACVISSEHFGCNGAIFASAVAQ